MGSASDALEETLERTPKDKSCLLHALVRYLDAHDVDRNQSVLVLGAGNEDAEILSEAGFRNVTMSNIGSPEMDLDAEAIQLPDNSYPIVFAHAVLHHCRCPHRAVGEMVRVAERFVFFFEPNDSWALRMLVRTGFSFPYELAAVVDHHYLEGGLRNGPVPNYIYRWTVREAQKCVSAYHAERQVQVYGYPYWDFYVNEYELLARRESRVAWLARLVGPRNLVAVLHCAQYLLNLLPPVRVQGNKFFCAIAKGKVQSWIELRDGAYVLKRQNT
jgi:methyltransferase family protein